MDKKEIKFLLGHIKHKKGDKKVGESGRNSYLKVIKIRQIRQYKKETMINSRTKGHAYERLITRELKGYFPDVITSRNGARGSDQAGIDVINTGMFNTQCKARQNLNILNIINHYCPTKFSSR